MTGAHESDVTLQIEIWEKNKIEGLSTVEKLQLLRKALFVVEQRTLKTLSNVTLEVVLDRALHQSREKYELLSAVKLSSHSLNFDGLLEDGQFRDPQEECVQALRHLLIEILTVLGSITAGILTQPLYQELFAMTHDPMPDAENQKVTRIHSGRRNSENS